MPFIFIYKTVLMIYVRKISYHFNNFPFFPLESQLWIWVNISLDQNQKIGFKMKKKITVKTSIMFPKLFSKKKKFQCWKKTFLRSLHRTIYSKEIIDIQQPAGKIMRLPQQVSMSSNNEFETVHMLGFLFPYPFKRSIMIIANLSWSWK